MTEGKAMRAELARFRSVGTVVERVTTFVHHISLSALRVALGAVLVWFGALKVADNTPVTGLVEGTTPWGDPSWFVPALGAFEVALGLWVVVGRWLLFALPLLGGHMLGTFGVMVFLPEVAFQDGNPLLLTMEGEFVAKNLVLLAAAFVVATRAHRMGARGSPQAM